MLLLLVAVAGPAGAASPEWRTQRDPVRFGPLPARVRNPLYVLHLQPGFERARVTPPGRLAVSFEVDWANIYDKWAKNVAGGLNRGRYDLEIVRPSAQIRLGLPRGLEVGIEIPLIALTGGIGDPLIQGWHRAFGLKNGGRELVEDGSFTYDVGVPLVREWTLHRPTELRLGDVSTELRLQLVRPARDRPGVVLGGALKLPTGSAAHGAGSGAPDGLFLLSLEHGVGPFAFYGQIGLTLLGRTGHLGALLAPAAVSGGVAVEVVLTRHWSVVVQLRGSSPFHRGFVHPWMSRGPVGITVGSHVHVGDLDVALGMEQDLTGADPSSDVAVFCRATVTTR